MSQLSAAERRAQEFAVINAAQHLVFQGLTKAYGSGPSLGSCCPKIGSGSTPRGGEEVYVSTGIPFIRSLNVRHFTFSEHDLVRIPPEIDESMKSTRVLPDDVLLNITGASIGRSCCVPARICPANVSQHVCVIRTKKGILNPQFLMYWLNARATQELIDGIQKGATRQALTKAQIEAFAPPAAPYDEQEQVATFLWHVERGENFLEVMLPANLKQVAPILIWLKDIATKIEEARRLRSRGREEAEALTTAMIGKVFRELGFDGHLGQVLLEKPRNGWSARCDGLASGTPVLSLGAVKWFRYRPDEFKRTSEPTWPQAHYWLREGDLLITRSNTPELVGHAAIYNGHPHPCIYPDLMMRLSIDEKRADKRFVHYLLRSGPVRDYIRRSAQGTSPTMKKISQGIVMGVPFTSGLCLADQRCIVAHLDAAQRKWDDLTLLQAQTAAELDALLPSVLDRAFNGEL